MMGDNIRLIWRCFHSPSIISDDAADSLFNIILQPVIQALRYLETDNHSRSMGIGFNSCAKVKRLKTTSNFGSGSRIASIFWIYTATADGL